MKKKFLCNGFDFYGLLRIKDLKVKDSTDESYSKKIVLTEDEETYLLFNIAEKSIEAKLIFKCLPYNGSFYFSKSGNSREETLGKEADDSNLFFLPVIMKYLHNLEIFKECTPEEALKKRMSEYWRRTKMTE